jgi:hypothetical protein
MGPTYLPSDVFSESSLVSPIADHSLLFFFSSGGGQFVLCGSSQLRGDW